MASRRAIFARNWRVTLLQNSMDLQVLGDRYEMLEPIGRGGMATIYKARDNRMGRMVAVKILREMYSSDPKFVLRFQREARAVSALAHPNIVQVFDYGQSNEAYYIVMELIEGSDLRRFLKNNGILDTRKTVVIAHDVALALGAAHRRGIVHRDVKPQNILVNDEALVKLTDFGIATFYRDAQSERLTTTGMTLGTVQYYAPEQAQGEVVSPAADVYALGVVMYEMLVGHPPFDGDTPVAIAVRHIQEPPVRPSRYNPNIPPALERIILRCLEKDPRDRYRDGDALAYALETYDKPRSSGRMSTPVGAANGPMRSPSRPINDNGRLPSGPRPPSGPIDRDGDDYGVGPTRAEIAAGTMPRPGMNYDGQGDDEDRPSPVAGITTAVIVASVLLLLAVSCFITYKTGALSGIFGGTTPAAVARVKVPNFVGLQYPDAQVLGNKDLLTIKQNPEASDKPAGQVLDQNPAADTMVDLPTTVTLGVSSGPGNVPIPDVSGQTQQQACANLKLVNLICKLSDQLVQNSVYGPGKVDHTDPPIAASVAPNSTVTLFLSAGPAPTVTPVVSPTPTVTAAPPQISVSPNPATGVCSTATGITLTITNTGDGTLTWNASPSVGLTVSAPSGSVVGHNHTGTVNVTGPNGTAGTITFSGNGGSPSVTITCTP